MHVLPAGVRCQHDTKETIRSLCSPGAALNPMCELHHYVVDAQGFKKKVIQGCLKLCLVGGLWSACRVVHDYCGLVICKECC